MPAVKQWERRVLSAFKRVAKYRGTDITGSLREGIYIAPLKNGGSYLNRIAYWIKQTTGATLRYNPRLVIFAGGQHSPLEHDISLNWESILNDGRDHKVMHEWVHAYFDEVYHQMRRCIPCGNIEPVDFLKDILFGDKRLLELGIDSRSNRSSYKKGFTINENFAYAETFFFLGKILNDIIEGEPDSELRQIVFENASHYADVALDLASATADTAAGALEKLKAFRSSKPEEVGALGHSEYKTREIYFFSPDITLEFDWFNKSRSAVEFKIQVEYNYRQVFFSFKSKEEDIVRATRMLHRKSASRRERTEARDTLFNWAESQLQANHEVNALLRKSISKIAVMMPSIYFGSTLQHNDEDRRDALYEPRRIIRPYMPR